MSLIFKVHFSKILIQGRTEVVRLLLKYNANVEHRAKTGLTPLMEASNGGYQDVGALLLQHGADPNAPPVPTSRDTALTIAADKGHANFVELLIHKKAAINVRNKKGCTALWLACNGGHLDTVQVLVKHNSDVDIADNRKVTPLMAAFRKGHVKVSGFYLLVTAAAAKTCDGRGQKVRKGLWQVWLRWGWGSKRVRANWLR